ncbi:hypothetical protein ACH4YO_42150 [Streptomyces noursei]
MLATAFLAVRRAAFPEAEAEAEAEADPDHDGTPGKVPVTAESEATG